MLELHFAFKRSGLDKNRESVNVKYIALIKTQEIQNLIVMLNFVGSLKRNSKHSEINLSFFLENLLYI